MLFSGPRARCWKSESNMWIGNFVLLISWNDWLTVWPMNACMHAHIHWMVLTRDWLTQINYCGRNWMQKAAADRTCPPENHPNILWSMPSIGNVVKLLGQLRQRIFILIFSFRNSISLVTFKARISMHATRVMHEWHPFRIIVFESVGEWSATFPLYFSHPLRPMHCFSSFHFARKLHYK